MNLWHYHIQAVSKWPPFGSDTESQTLLDIFGGGQQLLQGDSVSLPWQRLLQQLQTFLRLSTGPDLQMRPFDVVHRV